LIDIAAITLGHGLHLHLFEKMLNNSLWRAIWDILECALEPMAEEF
jgi:hypothetical protein